MTPFRFNLEKVLKVRQMESMKAKQLLAQAQLAAGKAWVALEAARAARESFETELEQQRRKGMTVGDWAFSSQRHDEMTAQEKSAAEALHLALATVTLRRAELEEAQRREKALDKLREQQLEAHKYSEQVAEQAETDEVAQHMTRAGKGVS